MSSDLSGGFEPGFGLVIPHSVWLSEGCNPHRAFDHYVKIVLLHN
jgi:hypothetical protein